MRFLEHPRIPETFWGLTGLIGSITQYNNPGAPGGPGPGKEEKEEEGEKEKPLARTCARTPKNQKAKKELVLASST